MARKVGRPRKIRPADAPNPTFVRLQPEVDAFVKSEAQRWGTSKAAEANRIILERMEAAAQRAS